LFLDASQSQSVTYLWHDSTQNPQIAVDTAGLFWVEVTNSCVTLRDEIQVELLDVPSVDLGDDLIICDDSFAVFNVNQEHATFVWTDGRTGGIRNIARAGNIGVNIYNQCGTDFDEILIEKEDCSCNLYVPNSITPNGDFLNDGFRAYSDCELQNFTLLVFNRWGDIVYSSTNINDPWFPEEHQDGVYLYKIEYQFERTKVKTKIGTVTLLK
ncbi:MAG: gliding motility-associated C-terminal domain-containing protein, partial [Flavobacteriales bacterium]|nr:gliding motility-associated C-terminal domain-containing protein [Flavobacteriales bacterium]